MYPRVSRPNNISSRPVPAKIGVEYPTGCCPVQSSPLFLLVLGRLQLRIEIERTTERDDGRPVKLSPIRFETAPTYLDRASTFHPATRGVNFSAPFPPFFHPSHHIPSSLPIFFLSRPFLKVCQDAGLYQTVATYGFRPAPGVQQGLQLRVLPLLPDHQEPEGQL